MFVWSFLFGNWFNPWVFCFSLFFVCLFCLCCFIFYGYFFQCEVELLQTTQYEYNTGENRRTVVSDTNGLLISDFSSSTRGERYNSYYANNLQRAAHLVMFKISVGRDLKNPTTYLNGRELNSMPQWQNLNYLPPWSNVKSQLYGRNSNICFHDPISTLNWLFFNFLKFSGPSLPGMTSSTLQPHFLSGGL